MLLKGAALYILYNVVNMHNIRLTYSLWLAIAELAAVASVSSCLASTLQFTPVYSGKANLQLLMLYYKVLQISAGSTLAAICFTFPSFIYNFLSWTQREVCAANCKGCSLTVPSGCVTSLTISYV